MTPPTDHIPADLFGGFRMCSIGGCNKRHHAHGLCKPHAKRAARGRDLSAPIGDARATIRRFLARVNKNGPTMAHMDSPCWEWVGSRHARGYGRIMHLGKRDSAHRVSWRLHHGDLPIESDVLHKCDNPPCVNPNHLWLGSNADNVADRNQKGRTAKGERIGSHRLTDAAVLEIREAAPTRDAINGLATKFGVRDSTIRNVINGSRWRHVSCADSK